MKFTQALFATLATLAFSSGQSAQMEDLYEKVEEAIYTEFDLIDVAQGLSIERVGLRDIGAGWIAVDTKVAVLGSATPTVYECSVFFKKVDQEYQTQRVDCH